MQNTRFNGLIEDLVERLGQGIRNPWRRLSVQVISLLFGVFLATAIITSAGQTGALDILFAAIMVFWSEVISRIAYGGNRRLAQSFLLDVLNNLKIGMSFGLVAEAFKLGS